jgi:dTDP-4-dehydrorhamnose reductase
MKVLVTGRQGQLVQSLIERAAGRPGIEIVAAGRPELDLEKPGSAAEAVRSVAPEVVINAAAFTAVDHAEDEPERAMRVNDEAAGELAAAAKAAGAPIVQISTDYVFDGLAPRPYSEDARPDPLGAYGRSKLAGEERVRRENPEHLILRTAWVYSPFGSNFVKTMMRLAETRDTVTVVADQQGNPTSALDLADALLAVLRLWKQGSRAGQGRTYHLAGTGSASWFSFAEAIFEECRALGLPAARVQPIRTKDWPTNAVRPANSRLDSSRFQRDFDFAMPDWQRSLAEVVRRIHSSAAAHSR